MIDVSIAKELSDVPTYQHVHSFMRTRYPGDGFWYCAKQVRPWCVSYGYAGHYFVTAQEALQYAAGRGFIPVDMIDRIKQNLYERGLIE